MLYCKKCDGEITKSSKSGNCSSCSAKNRKHNISCNCALCMANNGKFNKENHPNWSGGKAKCKDCSKIISTYNEGRCWNCYVKFLQIPENCYTYKEIELNINKYIIV